MAKRDLKHRGRILGNTGSDLENEGVGIRELPGSESETQGGRILGNRGSDSGHPSYLQPVVLNQIGLEKELSKKRGSTTGLTPEYRGNPECDLFFFPSENLADGSLDWARVTREAAKFKVIPCRKKADRQFLYKAIALTQATIPPFALWDALEAVKQIGPAVPIAYFRTVLRDNCRKSGVNLDAAVRTVRLPEYLDVGTVQIGSEFKLLLGAIGGVIPQDPARPTPAEILKQIVLLYHADKEHAL